MAAKKITQAPNADDAALREAFLALRDAVAHLPPELQRSQLREAFGAGSFGFLELEDAPLQLFGLRGDVPLRRTGLPSGVRGPSQFQLREDFREVGPAVAERRFAYRFQVAPTSDARVARHTDEGQPFYVVPQRKKRTIPTHPLRPGDEVVLRYHKLDRDFHFLVVSHYPKQNLCFLKRV